uniref:G-protein coupled receptors family 1 profile domain-containing protein n=1 Tax=Terrapene triunguis TaxID=2587831 RepID=A0A674JDE0_9SAUR
MGLKILKRANSLLNFLLPWKGFIHLTEWGYVGKDQVSQIRGFIMTDLYSGDPENRTECQIYDLPAVISDGVTLLICFAGLVRNWIVLWFLSFCIKRNPFTVYILSLATTASISTERYLSFLNNIWCRCYHPKHLPVIICALLWALFCQLRGLVTGYSTHVLFFLILCVSHSVQYLLQFISSYHQTDISCMLTSVNGSTNPVIYFVVRSYWKQSQRGWRDLPREIQWRQPIKSPHTQPGRASCGDGDFLRSQHQRNQRWKGYCR